MVWGGMSTCSQAEIAEGAGKWMTEKLILLSHKYEPYRHGNQHSNEVKCTFGIGWNSSPMKAPVDPGWWLGLNPGNHWLRAQCTTAELIIRPPPTEGAYLKMLDRIKYATIAAAENEKKHDHAERRLYIEIREIQGCKMMPFTDFFLFQTISCCFCENEDKGPP